MQGSANQLSFFLVSLLNHVVFISLDLVGITVLKLPLLVLSPNAALGISCNRPEGESVCGTKLRVSTSVIIDESPYCYCASSEKCGPNWDINNEFSAFTWYHHERVDWVVHYLFCKQMASLGLCDSLAEMDEVVAVVRVEKIHKNLLQNYNTTWLPYLHRRDCKCREGIYYMHSWMLVKEAPPGSDPESTKEKDKKSFWEYNYTCDRHLCKRGEACNKQYMDQSSTHGVGYRFECSCPEGYYCPAGKSEKIKKYEVDDADEWGPYLWGYCTPILGWDVAKNDED